MMKKSNILSIAQKAIRDSGKTNMWGANDVQRWAFYLGFFELVTWIEENPHRYTLHMMVTDYDLIPSTNLEPLLAYEQSAQEARLIVKSMFEKEIKEYAGGFLSIEKIPCTFEDYTKTKKPIYSFLSELSDLHTLNYLFTPARGKEYVWFKDGLYHIKGNKVDKEEWTSITREKDTFNTEIRSQYEQLHQYFRLKMLF